MEILYTGNKAEIAKFLAEVYANPIDEEKWYLSQVNTNYNLEQIQQQHAKYISNRHDMLNNYTLDKIKKCYIYQTEQQTPFLDNPKVDISVIFDDLFRFMTNVDPPNLNKLDIESIGNIQKTMNNLTINYRSVKKYIKRSDNILVFYPVYENGFQWLTKDFKFRCIRNIKEYTADIPDDIKRFIAELPKDIKLTV